MPSLKLEKEVNVKLNTDTDLLITGGPYLYFMNGNAGPVAGSDWHLITGPQVVPAGVGAYLTAYQEGVELVVSGFTPGTGPATAPFTILS